MARPRLPTALHEVKETYWVNPGRRPKAEPKHEGPLGAPPPDLDEVALRAWTEIVERAAPGVLTRSDWHAVELTARLLADLRRSREVRPAVAARLEACLGRLGMTPADRSRVSAAEPEKGPSPWDELDRVQ